MLIGVPKEIKDNESRVGLTAGSVRALTRRGHRVLVQSGAGVGSAISDQEYLAAGAEIVAEAVTVCRRTWWSRSKSRSSQNIAV